MLLSSKIQEVLVKQGWRKKSSNSKNIEYSRAGISVYTKINVDRLPLIIHPKNNYFRDKIGLITGVKLDEKQDYYFNDTMRAFPVRSNRGNSPRKHGVALSFKNIAALEALISFLLSGEVSLLTDLQVINNQNLDKTEKETLIKSRLGQGKFRDDLAEIHNSQCQLSYVDKLDLLRASHIKPWSKCDNDAERLDSDNGLLLAIQYDLLFDKAYISFQDDGSIIISDIITDKEREIFQLNENMQITMQSSKQKAYMKYHREQIFLKQNSSP